MKLQNLYLGKPIKASTTASMVAWLSLVIGLLPAGVYLQQLLTVGTINYGALTAFLLTMAVMFVVLRINKTNPDSQYVITRVLEFDATGTKATRVEVQYRDGSRSEKTFAA